MNEEQTIGALNIKFTANAENVEETIDDIVKLIEQMQDKIDKVMNKAVQDSANQGAKAAAKVKKAVNEMNKAAQNKAAVKGLKKIADAFKNIIKFAAFSWLGHQIVNLEKTIFLLGSDMAETENLFQVSFGDMADRATEFTETLQDAWGVNPTPIKEQTAYLNQMLKSMKLGEDTAYTMATSLEKLSYNMSSLYNISQDVAFEKLRSGIAGKHFALYSGDII